MGLEDAPRANLISQKPMILQLFCLAPGLVGPHLEATLGELLGHLGSFWELSALRAPLEPSWHRLEPSWSHLGTILGYIVAVLEPSWSHLGAILEAIRESAYAGLIISYRL